MKGDKVIRWDNVPHHKAISTYPHHAHENEMIKESGKMDIGMVLEEIKKLFFQKETFTKETKRRVRSSEHEDFSGS